MTRVAVIDYGMGNLHSVAKAVEFVGEGRARVDVTPQEDRIMASDRVIFPGVGAMRDCMGEIRRLGVDDMLRRLVSEKPVLAICVGMQALFEYTEENEGVECIGLFRGRVRRFPEPHYDETGQHLKVPHMGWNTVRQVMAHPLWRDIEDNSRFYFVHSYYAVPADDRYVVGESDYPWPFAVAMAAQNIFAVQFHPEKSQDNGLRLLKNFLGWDGSP